MIRTSILSAICLAVALGCSAKTSEAPESSGTAAATFNANCPMMGNEVTPEGGTVSFHGQTIGFCCDGCAPKFEKLSDQEKIAALAKHGTTLPQ